MKLTKHSTHVTTSITSFLLGRAGELGTREDPVMVMVCCTCSGTSKFSGIRSANSTNCPVKIFDTSFAGIGVWPGPNENGAHTPAICTPLLTPRAGFWPLAPIMRCSTVGQLGCARPVLPSVTVTNSGAYKGGKDVPCLCSAMTPSSGGVLRGGCSRDPLDGRTLKALPACSNARRRNVAALTGCLALAEGRSCESVCATTFWMAATNSGWRSRLPRHA